MSVDFSAAFDKISHTYRLEVLKAHGFRERFQRRIMRLYEKSASMVQIYGFRSSLIPINSSVRQGCSLSMQLFTLCLNPLLQTLERGLTAIQIGRRHKTAVIAYADDVTIILTTPGDVRRLQETLHTYEAATGAKVKMRKSRALALGGMGHG